MLLWIRGIAALGLVVGLVFYMVSGLRFLIREPTQREFGFLRFLAWLAIIQLLMDLVLTRGRWLHLTYGVLTASLLHFVGGLQPGAWFHKSLTKPPSKVGPYVFWASFIGLLLTLRFVFTR